MNNRLGRLPNLLFFIWVLACACKRNGPAGIQIHWDNNQAKEISIPEEMLPGLNPDSVLAWVKIRALHSVTNILGDYRLTKVVLFQPLIPFTRETVYEVFYKNKSIGQYKVPAADLNDAPKVLSIYPQQDTLPENLLKIYIQFSQPMREGLSEPNIKIVKSGNDTLQDVFLNLIPELWNENRTVITLWLDPGRIKRDLQPNTRLGVPLKETGIYQLAVLKQWKNAQGLALQKEYIKTMIVGKRDSLSPDPQQWKLQTPKAGSSDALIINLREPLDHFLLLECMRITARDGSEIIGRLVVENKDTQCRFIPAVPWVAGDYQLIIESRLEDLSGNNLNRPFDRDMSTTKVPTEKNNHSRNFQVIN